MQAKKNHTHVTEDCGYVTRAKDNPSSAPRTAFPKAPDSKRPHDPGIRTRGNDVPVKPDIKCYFCGGPHMKRDCLKHQKLRQSDVFMTMARTYEEDEIPYLNILMSSTNRRVCHKCLDKQCDGHACGPQDPAMISAKKKYFNNGAYEEVLSVKLERPDNEFGHLPLSRDTYLSSYERSASEGAYTESDESERQEDICIMAKISDSEKDENEDIFENDDIEET